jgi:hypothetical protein
MIGNSTRLSADQAEELARRIAAAHSDALYEHLTEQTPAGGRRRAAFGSEGGMGSAERRRAPEMHRSAAGARMGV